MTAEQTFTPPEGERWAPTIADAQPGDWVWVDDGNRRGAKRPIQIARRAKKYLYVPCGRSGSDYRFPIHPTFDDPLHSSKSPDDPYGAGTSIETNEAVARRKAATDALNFMKSLGWVRDFGSSNTDDVLLAADAVRAAFTARENAR